ncbi:duplicated ATPase component BL0693 of energizing module of predicted ECF transporter [Cutibacterium acnes JCM 18909]|nr:duplicated ATPase component BL0693 of energizing module of predicted ECF transporter [Cutibacterium acnes JCM 18909]
MNGLVPQFFGGKLRGHVMVQGTDLASVELHNVGRTSAMIFQNPRTQFFTSSVRTELAFGLENYGSIRLISAKLSPVRFPEPVSLTCSTATSTLFQEENFSGSPAPARWWLMSTCFFSMNQPRTSRLRGSKIFALSSPSSKLPTRPS